MQSVSVTLLRVQLSYKCLQHRASGLSVCTAQHRASGLSVQHNTVPVDCLYSTTQGQLSVCTAQHTFLLNHVQYCTLCLVQCRWKLFETCQDSPDRKLPNKDNSVECSSTATWTQYPKNRVYMIVSPDRRSTQQCCGSAVNHWPYDDGQATPRHATFLPTIQVTDAAASTGHCTHARTQTHETPWVTADIRKVQETITTR